MIFGRDRLTNAFRGMLVVALLAAALSGCGSDDESNGSGDSSTTTGESSSLEGWARGLCTTVATWQATIKSTSAKMANFEADFAQASEAVTQANSILIGSLKGLGTPPDPATSEAADAIDELRPSWKTAPGRSIRRSRGSPPRVRS